MATASAHISRSRRAKPISATPPTTSRESASARPTQDGFAGYVVGLLPLGNAFALFGKLGAYDVDLDFGGDTATESGTELAYGAGLRYDFANGLGLLGEWERFDDVAVGDCDLFSVGLSCTF